MKRFVFLTVFALAFLIVVGCGGKGEATGKAVFAISDAAGDMGAVSSIKLTVDSVQVHTSGGAWANVSSQSQTFDLIKLRNEGTAQLLAQADLKAGSYDMVSLGVSKVVVVDSSGEHEAKLPSSKLQVKGSLDVNANTSATANFDFLADQSLHVTGNGQYILAPVVKLETRANAKAEIQSNNIVKFTGGTVKTNTQVGMDIEGSTDVGLRISPDAVLTVAASGKIIQTKGHAIVAGTIKSVNTADGTVTLTTKSGNELVLHVAGDSSLKVNGSTATLASLSAQIGSEVTTQYNAETKAVARLAAGADAQAKADVGANINISGVIKSVNTNAGTVTVTTDGGADVVLKVGSGVNVNVGSNINAKYDGTTGTTGEIKAESESSVSLSGTIKAVNPAEGTVTVTSQSGADTTLKIASNTRIMVNGSVKTLAELKGMIGTQATLTYSQQTKLVREINASGQASGSASASVSGVIKAVNPLQGTVTITTSSGKDIVLNVAANSVVVADGTVSTLVDLATKIGARVDASYDTQTSVASNLSAQAQASGSTSASVSGVIKAVNPVQGTVTIATSSGQDVVLNVTANSKVVADGTVSTLVDLATKIGAKVDASYDTQTSVASDLSAQAQASGSTSTSAKVYGTLKAVDTLQGTVTVATESGADVVLKVTGDTEMTLDGGTTVLLALSNKLGTTVSASYDAQTMTCGSLTARTLPSPPTATSATATGTLKAVDTSKSTVTIATQSGAEVVLKIAPDTKTTLNGAVVTLIILGDNIGAQVTVGYFEESKLATSLTAQVQPTSTITVSGVLKTYNSVSNNVTVLTQSGTELVLTIGGETKVKLNGATSPLISMPARVGSQVTAEYQATTNILISLDIKG